MNRRRLLRSATFASLGLVAPFGLARAKDWPQRPVKFIVSFGPGSASDITARLAADKLSAIWGRPIVVENRPGGDAIVSISAMVGANDDHVLLFTASSTFTPHPFVHEKLPYDPQRDLVPIAGLSELNVAIAVPQKLNVDSLAELESLARREPGKLNWGAISSLDDFVFSGFLKGAGLTMSRVPYRDPVGALNDLSEGRIDVCLAALALVLPRVQTGQVKAIAITNREHSPAAANLPTVFEAGYPALSFAPVLGLFAPRVMDDTIRNRIAADLRTVAADPAVVARLGAIGQSVRFVPLVEFVAGIEQERAKIAAIAKALDIRPNQ